MNSPLNSQIQITIKTQFNEDNSFPQKNLYLYKYTITIKSELEDSIQLLRRYWKITDGLGHTEEVEGEGVIGQQPTFFKGKSFEYSSYCPLRTPSGEMGGYFTFINHNTQKEFKVPIEPFILKEKQFIN